MDATTNRQVLDSVPDGVFTVDLDWRITSFNRAAEQITGMSRKEALGQRCCEVFRASICENECALRQTLATQRPVANKVVYIVSPSGERIPISISTAPLRDAQGRVIGGVESFRDLRVVEELRRQAEEQDSFSDIIGRSPAMRRLFDILPAVAGSDSTVLLEGASGTGKELFARALHRLSRRHAKRFVALNCGALPDTLLESELFGYKAGAFTDARKDKPGRFALAEGGTIFLDEIADVSPAMQMRLLRVLQERVYEPLGSVEPVKSDVRVVAATNKSLASLVREARFREDLFYRVNIVRMELPAPRPPGGYPTLGRAFRDALQPASGAECRRAVRRDAGAADGTRFPRQHPRAGKHHRARVHPLRERSDRTQTSASTLPRRTGNDRPQTAARTHPGRDGANAPPGRSATTWGQPGRSRPRTRHRREHALSQTEDAVARRSSPPDREFNPHREPLPPGEPSRRSRMTEVNQERAAAVGPTGAVVPASSDLGTAAREESSPRKNRPFSRLRSDGNRHGS
jgi:PAS domain S-box-containing protein